MKILSLTGYGRSIFQIAGLTVSVEIKTVNGKNMDAFIKMPSIYNELEMGIRSLLQELLHRGSITVIISRQDSRVSQLQLNKPLLQRLLSELNEIVPSTEHDKNLLLTALVRLPDAMQNGLNILDKEEAEGVINAIKDAAMQVTKFREQEGANMKIDLVKNNQSIISLLEEVIQLAPARNIKQKEELLKKLNDIGFGDKIDNNRMEQELIYYTEKLDINEECVRLKNHCIYFEEILNNSDISKGKKLGFIAQEMVREINTTGSKANDAAIQKIVMQMKEEAEKIKEQLLNVV
ncbi:MAG: hypothetical protein RL065_2154 [Bacteroidota bacterium]|jgi:uncharacterized protein (TIGR00255 family)